MVRRLGAVAIGLTVCVGCGGRDGGGDVIGYGDTGDTGDTSKSESESEPDPWPPAWKALEEEVLMLVNEARAQPQRCGGASMPAVGPLQMQPLLRDVARAHSEDMAVRRFFSHVNPDGDDPFDRLDDAGWAYAVAGENIAQGYPDAEQVMAGWMTSPGHCANIMERGYRWIGIGYYEGNFWTEVFGG